MKKILLYSMFLALLTSVPSCKKDLNREPKNLVSESVAYGSLTGIEALTATLYNDMEVEDLDYIVGSEGGYTSTTTDEALRSYSWGVQNDPVIGNWFGVDWTNPNTGAYVKIRRVNDFIEKVPTAPATLSDEVRKRFVAEGRFIRAFNYFTLVKRYGGVPLVTKVQQFTPGGDVTKLGIARAKEQEVYDFIATELDEAIADLPETYSGSNAYRVTRYAALALKCRAMLYAASSAKYATLQINGLVGIPASLANSYWQKAMAAAKLIIDSHEFSLYNVDADKATNFQKLFLTAGNSEAIFTKTYLAPDKAHSFDFFNAPQSFKVDYGCATNPTLEMVEEFEYVDGSPGALKVKDALGNAIVYNKPGDIFKNKDPRMFATILTPFDSWQGGIVEIRRGVIDGGVKYTSEQLTEGYPTNEASFKKVGKDGPLTTSDPTKTGFYIKKFMNPVSRIDYGLSTTPWMVFRYAEVLLNYAEAAFELNMPNEARDAINLIRDRAGIAQVSMITLDKIRHERKVELAFENHRIWDIRRWRIATTVLNNTQFHALYPWAMWGTAANTNDLKYTFEIVSAPKNTRTFPEKLYYEPVPQGNPTYVQNPLY
ncbi:RagB/SusD family nutrient uptake outer membrane protein [Pedobacter nutrimenti]|uniref:RagB/SusD family nutrient uptake outer membrane protein n=1 Tax=Pedobacter nutrimenti TaxID=1241337 RepID=UPI002930364D|nr:RagB/SusD family nutrient uptake outer membrane protein [Pedobacter nutrimenti]